MGVSKGSGRNGMKWIEMKWIGENKIRIQKGEKYGR